MDPTSTNREKKIVTAVIIFGITLYLSKFLRPWFSDNNCVLSILGFLPNIGLALAIPFIYVSNRVRLNKPVNHFKISCLVTFVLMILNEIRDKYQPGRVFDWYDLYASFAGVVFALFVFQVTFKRTGVRKDRRPTIDKA